MFGRPGAIHANLRIRLQQVRARIRNTRPFGHCSGLPELPLDRSRKETVRLCHGGINRGSSDGRGGSMRLVRSPGWARGLRIELRLRRIVLRRGHRQRPPLPRRRPAPSGVRPGNDHEQGPRRCAHLGLWSGNRLDNAIRTNRAIQGVAWRVPMIWPARPQSSRAAHRALGREIAGLSLLLSFDPFHKTILLPIAMPQIARCATPGMLIAKVVE
jgi:hypothetical protein